MNPGRMDRRLTVQAKTLSKDSSGGRVETWVDAFECWGEIVRHASNRNQVADADRPDDTKQFRIRYKSGIGVGTHRILYQLQFFSITGITEEGRRDRMLLTCRSLQSLTN